MLVPRLGRRRLDVPPPRLGRARLPGFCTPRRPRAPRRRVRRRRRFLCARTGRRGGGCPGRREERGRAARAAVRPGSRAPPRDRAHALRPGRDDPLPARDERQHARCQGAARGRRRAAAALPVARGDRGLLPRARTAVSRRFVERGDGSRAAAPRGAAGARADSSGRAREHPPLARRASRPAAGARGAARCGARLEARRPRRRRPGGAGARPALARARAGRAAR